MKIKLDNYTGNASSLQVSFDGGETYTKTIAVNNSNNTLLFNPNNDNCVSLDDIKIKGDKTEITPEFNSNLELALINKILYSGGEYEWVDLAEYPAFVEALIKNAGDNNINSNYSHDDPTIKSWQFYDWEYWDTTGVVNAYVPFYRSAWIWKQLGTEGYPTLYFSGYYKFNFNNLSEEQKEPVAIGLLCLLNNTCSMESDQWDNQGNPFKVGAEFVNGYFGSYGTNCINVDLSTFPDISWENIPGCSNDGCNRQFNQGLGIDETPTIDRIYPLFGRSLSKFYYMPCNKTSTRKTTIPLYIPKGYNFPEDLVIYAGNSYVPLTLYIHEEDIDNLFAKINGESSYGDYKKIQINIIPAKEGKPHYLSHDIIECSNIDLRVLHVIRENSSIYYYDQTCNNYDSENPNNNRIDQLLNIK